MGEDADGTAAHQVSNMTEGPCRKDCALAIQFLVTFVVPGLLCYLC